MSNDLGYKFIYPKFDEFLNSLSTQINFTIALEAEDEILLYRLLKRGETSGRIDDIDKEKILNRFKEYTDKTFPLKEFYSKEQILEVVAVISFFGFLNRWNDTFGTEIEAVPANYLQNELKPSNW